MSESMEQVLSGREQLISLESEGKYLFHGSGNLDLETLEPRQAYTYKDGVQVPDGEPAVFTSSKADYAIMLALINKRNCPKEFRTSAASSQNKKGKVDLTLRASKISVEQLNDGSHGCVYVFDKDVFQKKGGAEYLSSVPVISVKKIRVTKADLPPSVEVY